ncbi:hypothetical protein [Microvirga aerophila]|jgi:hypothetical protein|uniref:Uncharacterized protein n=1 Tax=Microvirga aerophila TaxID=670291 RepID=A0A512BRV2_9HYPH|nr:hypothetical protein [Microvirga aerophila]GEO14547.1 hypothetical protein MAE02_22430 [Microvirga aerophila]
MLTKDDLDAPARLQYEKTGASHHGQQSDWGGAQEFSSLREAIHQTMNAEPPAGMEPVIRTASGALVGPDQLEEIWLSIQGP